jgi:hypothetical protein
MNKKNLIVACLIIVVGLVVLYAGKKSDEKIFGISPVTFVNTSTSVTLGAATGDVLASNQSRRFASICNTSTTAPVFLYLKAATSTIPKTSGLYLASSQCFQINETNLYTGVISASGTTGMILTITEF